MSNSPAERMLALLAVVVLAAAAAAAAQVTAAEAGLPAIPVDPPQQELEVSAFPLTQLPGCNYTTGDNFELPVGLLGDDCSVVVEALAPADPQLFTFSVPAGGALSVVLGLSVQGGTASMSLWLPGMSVQEPPAAVQSELFSSPASSEGWISIPPAELQAQPSPGKFLLSVTAFSGSPRVTLTVTTPGKDLQLVPSEVALLRGMTEACCTGKETEQDSPFCAVIAPQSLGNNHSWVVDPCHLAPSGCNAEGRLTRLALPAMGLACASFPAQLGQLAALQRLDLAGNNLEGATLQQVAEVVSRLSSLQELALGSTRISGNLSCDLPASLKVLDVAYNRLQGSVPACLLNSLTELYVPGNALSGSLPPPAATSPLTTLYANAQHGGGLSGSIPVSIGSLRRLQFINLSNNKLSGALPGLPAALKLLNISGNSVTGRLGSLPAGLWQLDVADNDLAGPLPGLAGLAQLEMLVANNNPRLGGGLTELPPGLQHLEAVNCGLKGQLLAVPRGMTRLDLSDNALTGQLPAIDTTQMEVLRAANNSLSGPLPSAAASSPRLFLLDLHGNSLSGPLPEQWGAPRLQIVMLEDNALIGSIPAGLASLPNLGVLRLGGNKLNGSLTAFAAALNDPAAAAAAKDQAAAGNSSSGSNSIQGLSRLFDLNLTANQLTGPVPAELSWLGVFNPNITILVPGSDGTAAIAPRVLDLSGNQLAGDWPHWLLKAVPSTVGSCDCSVAVAVGGPLMRLACPPEGSSLSVTDFMWQTAAEQRYTCWAQAKPGQAAAGGSAAGGGGRQAQLLDYLASPSNNFDSVDSEAMALGDGGGQMADQRQAARKRGLVAGAVVGVVVGGALLAALGYFVVYRRLLQPAKATAFKKFEDDAAAGAGVAGAGGANDMQRLPSDAAAGSAAAAGPALSIGEAAARPL